jgi:heme/copper-type cytochrome/quinol oxidase subunit 3
VDRPREEGRVTPARRAGIDVSGLPTHVYGHRSTIWWGTAGFMLIEGTTLAICAAAYLYLRRNFSALPPERIAAPDLTVATVNVALMLASLVPNHLLSLAGYRKDDRAIKLLTLLSIAICTVFVVLRWFEFQALHVRWDQNAYGSAAWATLFFHGTLLAVEVGETAVMSAIFWRGRQETKHYSDVTDLCFYWYFMVLVWVPLYAMVFLLPRVM